MKIRSIKKYLAFTKGGILDGFAYKFSAFGWLLGDLFTLLILLYLWTAVYQNSPSDVINGLTFNQMITYLILARIVSPLSFSSFSFWSVGTDIYEGNIAISLTKPLNYRNRILFSSLGNYISNFILLFLPVSIAGFTILHFTIGTSIPGILTILLFLISSVLASIIYDTLNFIIGQLAIFTNALFGLMLIKETVLSFLSGSMLPVAFFPQWLQEATKYLPFTGMIQTPVMILMGSYSYQEILLQLLIQFLWVIILHLLAQLSFNGIKKHVVSAGG